MDYSSNVIQCYQSSHDWLCINANINFCCLLPSLDMGDTGERSQSGDSGLGSAIAGGVVGVLVVAGCVLLAVVMVIVVVWWMRRKKVMTGRETGITNAVYGGQFSSFKSLCEKG